MIHAMASSLENSRKTLSQRHQGSPSEADESRSAQARGVEGSASQGERSPASERQDADEAGVSGADERRVEVFEVHQDGSAGRSGGGGAAECVDDGGFGGFSDGAADDTLVELRLREGGESSLSAHVRTSPAGAAGRPPEPARAGGWQHASAHTVAAVFGAGVLSLPYALRWLGLAWGVALLSVACAVSYYSSYLLAVLGSEASSDNKAAGPISTFRDLGKHVFGPRAGLWMIAPFQFTVLVGTTIVYLTLGGESLSSIYATACEPRPSSSPSPCPPFPQWAWTLLFTCCCLLVAPRPGIHEVSWVSFLAAAMSVTYGTMAVVTSALDLADERGPARQASAADESLCDHHPSSPSPSATNPLLESFNAIGIILFSYGGHSVLPEIQATIKPDPTTTVRPMMRGVTAAYVPTTAIYFALAVVGHLAYGDCTHPNVLLSDSGTDGAARTIAAVADLLVAVHVFGSIQVYSQPVMQALQAAVRSSSSSSSSGTPSGLPRLLSSPAAQRYVVNLTYIAALGAVAASLPDASAVIGLVGGLAITWMTFVVPSVMFLVQRRGSLLRAQVAVNVLIVCCCSMLGMLATAGAGYRLSERFLGSAATVG